VSEIEIQPSTGKSSSAIGLSFLNHLPHTIGRSLEYSTSVEQYHALAHVVRDRVMENWIATIESRRRADRYPYDPDRSSGE
jgi:starch phosphorylase